MRSSGIGRALFMTAAAVSAAWSAGAARAQSPAPPPGAVSAGPLADAPRPGTTSVFPLSDLKPGMKGQGRTVFRNGKMETFDVEIIGAMENTSPKQTIVMARLVGGPLAQTGVIAGMSGSPVFIDGRLLGAVAYGFPFSKETIGGITPFSEMTGFSRLLDVPSMPRGPEARSTAAIASIDGFREDENRPSSWSRRDLPTPLDAASLVSSFDAARKTLGERFAARPSTGLAPLPLPLSISGLSGAAFQAAKGVFDGLGFTPAQTPSSAAGAGPGPLPPLTPGGPVAISLIQGDFDFSATGTVTHIEGDSVYAFGHPFFGLGPVDFPMRKAYVYDVFPSLYQSFKISTAHDVIGRFREDRATAISGTLGAGPRMIPVRVALHNRPGKKQDFSFTVVQDDMFTPLTVYATLLSVLQGQERGAGPATVEVDATVNFVGLPAVRLKDAFSAGMPGAQAAGLVGAALQFVLANDFRRIAVESVNVSLTAREAQETAVLERAWLERGAIARPGATMSLRAALRTWRGEEVVETIAVRIPESATPGRYVLMVSDGTSMSVAEQRELRQAFVPRSLEQILTALNNLRRSTQIYARLQRFEEGAAVGGVALPGLPPSAMQIIAGSEGGEPVVRTATTTIWGTEHPVGHVVRGARFVTLQIER